MREIPPVIPGEILLYDFILPIAAKELNISEDQLSKFLIGEVPISHEFAEILADYVGTSTEFWINLQSRYDKAKAKNLK